jgi:Protein of unknown function (DUF2911)
MMKISFVLMVLLFQLTAGAQQRVTNPNSIVDTFKKSIPCITKAIINGAELEINYYAPGVKGRTIWGGLVPFGEVWVTGAHNATSLRFSKPIIWGDKKVEAGKYALFTIPGKEEWIFILNKNFQQHLSDNYKQEEDVLRLTLKPVWQEAITERLQYSIIESKLIIAWEKMKLEIPLTIQ